MDKEELFSIINSTSSCINNYFDEYREEYYYEREHELKDLLNAILKDLSDDLIPVVMYERVSKLIDTLGIEKLKQRLLACRNQHNFELYKPLSDNIIINTVLVAKTYYLYKAIGFVNSNVVLIGANGSGKTTFANSIREQLESTDNGIVIPAQKILIFPTYDFIPTYKSAHTIYQSRQKEILDDKQTYNASKSDDIPYDLTKKIWIRNENTRICIVR